MKNDLFHAYFSNELAEINVYSSNIEKVEDILYILDLVKSHKYPNFFDRAVSLLSFCDSKLLSNAVILFIKKHILDKTKEQIAEYEDQCELIITALDNSQTVNNSQKIILGLLLMQKANCRRKLSRYIKASLIDLFKNRDDFDEAIINEILKIFQSDLESDKYIKDYAK